MGVNEKETQQFPKSNLCFLGYQVDKIHFEVNKEYKAITKKGVPLLPSFSRKIAREENGVYQVKLEFKIFPAESDENMPISLETSITGRFALQSDDINLVRHNAVAILFPYLRSLVSFITLNANVAPLVLPIVNTTELFDKSDDEKDVGGKTDLEQ
ncbi:protein-export chaperone SecB [Ethanoligenens sp.]|uniref:protein-export chaperone SecB n=1 Tax=Ethanoligenens sp. TaxID=2099655 RepID=UPI0039E898F3